jgi:CheY-like chemotaxis protein/anti-sigma regulatory factor (Ser/Thr protein kinase)
MATNNILIVDDDPEMHDRVRTMLKDSCWTPESTFSGEQALTKLQHRDYDVIVADILMPEMDGLTLLNRILAIRPEAKVLIMTAGNRPDRVARSMRGLAAGYLAKPFSKDKLLESLNEALAWDMKPDDIEVLSDKPNWIAVRARCTLAIAERIVRFFRDLPADLDGDQRDMASTAFRELLINAVEHGGRLDPEKKVELHFIRTELSIVYHVRDPGQGFSLDNLPHAAISNPDDPFEHMRVREEMGLRSGGFGLLLLKNFADELIYNSKGNEVILIKRL